MQRWTSCRNMVADLMSDIPAEILSEKIRKVFNDRLKRSSGRKTEAKYRRSGGLDCRETVSRRRNQGMICNVNNQLVITKEVSAKDWPVDCGNPKGVDHAESTGESHFDLSLAKRLDVGAVCCYQVH